ncbi:MAG: bifunctional glutamate N-acetyltransferase/amino-acid acetyltransferase ArgJ [Acidimicrobiaceae bacterium]|nr:bifunctional glutamate N-acetyltransferase/amino-acid acetyltransferase ArgJ [Acidimicrobiaceae bacterium]
MSVLFAQGFLAAGYASGIKDSGGMDLSLVAVSGNRAATAAVTFTQNLAAAAPVQVSREHFIKSAHKILAVILFFFNDTATTGEKGLADAALMCDLVAEGLGVPSVSVLVCSTGLIGIPMPTEIIQSGIPKLVKLLGGSDSHAMSAARAIMTTDTKEKLVRVEGGNFRIGGMAKGAAMLAPNMATMLAVLTTDAVISDQDLNSCLRNAVDGSFNRLVIDGCTSTNDTVICLSSSAGAQVDLAEFQSELTRACRSLAMQMALDAEGATKCVKVRIVGAKTNADADMAARKVAGSQLVQCSFYGADPYWGRLASELGSSGVSFDLNRLSVSYGSTVVAREGISVAHDMDGLKQYMSQAELEVTCDLGLGNGSAEIITTDLTPGYIAENMRTS